MIPLGKRWSPYSHVREVKVLAVFLELCERFLKIFVDDGIVELGDGKDGCADDVYWNDINRGNREEKNR